MENVYDNFDVVFQKIDAISEEAYSVEGLSIQDDLDDIAELRRFATELNDRQGVSYTSS
jgi:hypothetical protein